MSGTTSRAKAQAQLLHWRDNIFGLEGPLLKWFNGQTFSRIEDFTKMTDQEVHGIEYKDEDGCSIAAPRHHRAQLKASIGYFHYVTYHHHGIDVMYCRDVVNVETFDKFFTRDYDPSKPTIRYTPEYIEALKRKKKLIEREDELHMMRMSIERKKLSSMNFRYTRMADEEEPCQHEVTEYLKGHCEGSFVYTHAAVESKVELPWKLCSTQHRHIHKEDVAVEEGKVGTSSTLEPHKEPNVDVEDNGTFTIGVDEASVEKYEVLEETSEEFLQSIRAEDKVNIEITDSVNTLHGVKNMLDLCGQSSERKEDPTNRMKTYDGSTWNILIKWSSGEYSWKPNTIYMAADVAEYTESLEVDQLQKHHLFVICGYPPPTGYKLALKIILILCLHWKLLFQDEGESQMVNPSQHLWTIEPLKCNNQAHD
jgi:hypothetical protein